MVQLNPQLKQLLTPKLTKYIPHTPTPKQAAFLWLNTEEAFFGGAAGGGKSDALLMAALQYVDVPGYNALLLRDTYANLVKPEGLLDRANEWLTPTDANWIGDMKAWSFPSGATVSFGYLDGPRDHFNYQGPAYQFVGIDEIVNIKEHQALYLFSRLRKKTPESYIEDILRLKKFDDPTKEFLNKIYIQYKNIPMRFRSASNPPRLEQLEKGAWVKTRYVDKTTRQRDIIYIPSKLEDNPHLDEKEYRKSLAKLDPITRKQLEDGDWDVHVQGRFFNRKSFKLVDHIPNKADIQQTVRRWDLAATEEDPTKDPAYTVGVRMHLSIHGDYYIDSVVRFRESPRGVEQLIRQTADMDGRSVSISMEQEPGSGGVNTIDHYRTKILPDFPFYEDKKTGSKIDEARPFAGQAEAGNIYLLNAEWNEAYLDELDVFPDGKFKDQVDASTGAYNFLAQGVNVAATWV